jgi:DNA-binding XRE family transcriptional regulator
MSSVGEKLKQRRQSLSLTQQQVADVLGVSVTTVKNWEAGRHIPKLYLAILRTVFKEECARNKIEKWKK